MATRKRVSKGKKSSRGTRGRKQRGGDIFELGSIASALGFSQNDNNNEKQNDSSNKSGSDSSSSYQQGQLGQQQGGKRRRKKNCKK